MKTEVISNMLHRHVPRARLRRGLPAAAAVFLLVLTAAVGPVSASVTTGLANAVLGQTGADGLPDLLKGAGTLSGSTNAGAANVTDAGFGNIIGQQAMYSKPVIDETNHRLYVADMGNNRIVFYNLTTGNALIDATQDGVIGQGSLFRSDPNRANVNPTQSSLLGADSVAIDGTHLWVADTKNNRVLRFTNVVGDGSDTADMVIGQADYVTNTANRGTTVGSTTLNTPTDVYADGGGVWVADSGNHRILYFATPVGDGSDAAAKVVGQPNLTTGSSGLTAGKLNTPVGITVIGGDLWVADRANHRVLRFTSPTGSGSDTASVVLGQDSFTVNNRTKPAQNALNTPVYLSYDATGNRLYVSEFSGNRVTGWDLPTSGSGTTESADVLMGQGSYTAAINGGGSANSSSPATASSLSFPNGAAWSASTGTLYVFDSGNARITQYDSPTGTGPTANRQLGQSDFTSHFTNGSPNSVSTLQGGLAVDRTRHLLYVGDTSNHRVLMYQLNGVNRLVDHVPDGVIGQPNLMSNNRNRGGSTAPNGLGAPSGLKVDPSGNLWVIDNLNSRAIRFPVPIGDGSDSADKVIGQADLVSGGLNRGGSPAANTLRNPVALEFDGAGALWVADFGNNRLVRFPTQIGDGSDTADKVVGQANFASNSANRGGSPAPNTVNLPESIVFDSAGRMWITDALNHRVLRYPIPVGDGSDAADMVIGQVNYTSNSANRGGSVGPTTLNNPTIIALDAAGAIWIEDEANNRLLKFENPVGDGTDVPTKFIGQADLVSGSQNRGLNQAGADRLSIPYGLLIEPEGFWVGERLNHRVLYYNLGPGTPGQPSATSPTADTTPSFTWTAATETDHYEVQWSTDSGFASGITTATVSSPDCVLSTTVCNGPTGLAPGIWYVRVRAVDTASVTSAYSPTGSVTITDVPSPTPTASTSPTIQPTVTPGSGTGSAAGNGTDSSSPNYSFGRIPKSGQAGLILLATFVISSLLYYGRRVRSSIRK